MLGDDDDNFYEEAFSLNNGDLVCLFTDGIEENEDRKGKSLSTGRVMRVIKNAKSPEELNELLREKIDNFVHNEETDDTAFILVSWHSEQKVLKKAG